MATYMVTVAGSERHDGEQPYTYVIEAESAPDAALRVVAHHRVENEDDDVIPVEVLAGEPEPNCGYCWDELRET